jgi:uncharacterized membrane protein YfcA
MSNVQQTAITAALTAIVSAFLGYLAAQHYIETAAVNELAAAIVVLLVAGYGAWSNERKTKEREAVAVNKGIIIADSTVGATPLIHADAVPLALANVDLPVDLSNALAATPAEVKPSA